MARAMSQACKGLGENLVIFKRITHNHRHKTTIKIHRKTNEIKHLILSQTLRKVMQQTRLQKASRFFQTCVLAKIIAVKAKPSCKPHRAFAKGKTYIRIAKHGYTQIELHNIMAPCSLFRNQISFCCT